ncbi:C1QL [Mytilus edulis]|uniref:C1QL n=1 Tax=Mytilus edulis TaxID=6550 RepID=A0A8S3TDN9_MYTED|nr:C1QL [Mytilus edulis]
MFVLFLESFAGGNVINRLSQTERKVEALFDQLQQQNDEIMHLKQIIANKEITRRADHINPNRESRLLLPQSQTSTIAFYALSKTEQKVGPHHTLILDHVETNSGNAYNHHSGVFTAPSNGIYLFSYTVFPDSHSYGTIELIVNSQSHADIFIDSSPTDHDLGGTTGVAILYLKQNDVCYLRTHSTHTFIGNIYSSTSARTSFSGFKITTE